MKTIVVWGKEEWGMSCLPMRLQIEIWLKSLPTRKPDDAHQVGASPENQDRVLKEIDPKRRE